MFEEVCSIYSDALDNVGRYVDMDTGECIQQMSIRDFCLTDRWKPYVEKLRNLIAKHGAKAKKMQEYVDTKKQLPGATLSGLFAIYDDECTRKDGTKFIAPVSRRESHLQQHTGWLAIDIDLDDNQNLSNFDNIRMICRFRPEIALLMRSCSGTGYFGLVRLAYPDRHKEQFKALLKEYAAIGIMLDKQCGNIGRVRFASWDDTAHIYINDRCVEYCGLDNQDDMVLVPKAAVIGHPRAFYSSEHDSVPFDEDRLIEILVSELEQRRTDITAGYEAWVKIGWSLKSHPDGERLFHRVSALNVDYNPAETTRKWHQLGDAHTVSRGYFIGQCKRVLDEVTYRDCCKRVYR